MQTMTALSAPSFLSGLTQNQAAAAGTGLGGFTAPQTASVTFSTLPSTSMAAPPNSSATVSAPPLGQAGVMSSAPSTSAANPAVSVTSASTTTTGIGGGPLVAGPAAANPANTVAAEPPASVTAIAALTVPINFHVQSTAAVVSESKADIVHDASQKSTDATATATKPLTISFPSLPGMLPSGPVLALQISSDAAKTSGGVADEDDFQPQAPQSRRLQSQLPPGLVGGSQRASRSAAPERSGAAHHHHHVVLSAPQVAEAPSHATHAPLVFLNDRSALIDALSASALTRSTHALAGLDSSSLWESSRDGGRSAERHTAAGETAARRQQRDEPDMSQAYAALSGDDLAQSFARKTSLDSSVVRTNLVSIARQGSGSGGGLPSVSRALSREDADRVHVQGAADAQALVSEESIDAGSVKRIVIKLPAPKDWGVPRLQEGVRAPSGCSLVCADIRALERSRGLDARLRVWMSTHASPPVSDIIQALLALFDDTALASAPKLGQHISRVQGALREKDYRGEPSFSFSLRYNGVAQDDDARLPSLSNLSVLVELVPSLTGERSSSNALFASSLSREPSTARPPASQLRSVSSSGPDRTTTSDIFEASLAGLKKARLETAPLTIAELRHASHSEKQRVRNFKVMHLDYGEIEWLGETDLSNLDVARAVYVSDCFVDVYGDDTEWGKSGDSVPAVGTALNKPAIVRFYNVDDTCGEEDYREMLAKDGATFLSLSHGAQGLTLEFRVETFNGGG